MTNFKFSRFLIVSFSRLAALEGHYDIVQILLSTSADIDSKDADGRSTLYVLALDNRLAMAKYFLHHGSDVETRDLEVNSIKLRFPTTNL